MLFTLEFVSDIVHINQENKDTVFFFFKKFHYTLCQDPMNKTSTGAVTSLFDKNIFKNIIQKQN